MKIHNNKNEKTLFLNQPERGLHPHRIPEFLNEIIEQEDTFVYIITHSPIVLMTIMTEISQNKLDNKYDFTNENCSVVFFDEDKHRIINFRESGLLKENFGEKFYNLDNTMIDKFFENVDKIKELIKNK